MWEHTHKYVQNAFQDTPGKHRNWVYPPFENHFPRVFPCFFPQLCKCKRLPTIKEHYIGYRNKCTYKCRYTSTARAHTHIYMYVFTIYPYIYMPYMPRYAKHPSHGTCWLSPLWPCWAAAAAAAPRSPAPGLQRTGSPAASAARWPRRRPPGRTGDLGDAGVDLMGCQEISPTKLGILWGFKKIHPL